MKGLLRKTSIALVVLAIPFFTGCVGYVYDGGVGVGVGVGAPGWGWGGGWSRPNPGWGGGWHHGGGWSRPNPGWGGHHGGWGGRRFAETLENFSFDSLPEGDNDVAELASPGIESVGSENLSSAGMLSRDFQIRYDSAQKILKLASGRVSKKFCKDMGLVESDIQMLKSKQISEDAVLRVSQALNEDAWKLQKLAEGFLADINGQDN